MARRQTVSQPDFQLQRLVIVGPFKFSAHTSSLLGPPNQAALFSLRQTARLQSAETDNLNIVNYSHAEVIQQVDATLSRVQFGMSGSRKYMHLVGDIWANIAPWVLCIGTVGEVFAFIWITITTSSTTKTVNGKIVTQTTTNTPEWWVLISIFATIIALEMTFAV